MAGRVSGSSVRTQNRFCGLWMGCTVGPGPAGRVGGGGQGATVGGRAPWWPARESPPGLGGGHAAPAGSRPGSPGPSVRRGCVSDGLPKPTAPPAPGKGARRAEEPRRGPGVEGGSHHAEHGEGRCWTRPWQPAQAPRPPPGKCRTRGPACGSPRAGPAPAPGPGGAQRMGPQAPVGPTLPRPQPAARELTRMKSVW